MCYSFVLIAATTIQKLQHGLPIEPQILKMDIDEDDDFYAPEESVPLSSNDANPAETAQHEVRSEQQEEDLEEGEEEDEGEDSDSVRYGYIEAL